MSGLRCGRCGVDVVRRADGAAFHTDALPSGQEYHAPVLDREYAEDDGAGSPPGPAERTAAALEDIAEQLRIIAGYLLGTR